MKLRSGTVTERVPGRSSLESSRSTRTSPRPVRSRHNETTTAGSSEQSSGNQNLQSGRLSNVSDENELQSKKVKNCSTSRLSLSKGLVAFFIVTVAVVFLIIAWTKSKPVETYTEDLKNLSVSFPRQSQRLWSILRVRGLTHLESLAPPRPLVFMLAGPPDAHDTVNCLALRLARVIDPSNNDQLLIINGVEHSSNQGDITKIELDKQLHNHFQSGHKVAVIKELEALPATSPLLFHSYCDDQNAPYKDAVLIFTINLPRYPDCLSPVEAEGTVEKYLAKEVWKSPPYEQNAVAALLSRVADTVVLVHSEKKSVVERVCP